MSNPVLVEITRGQSVESRHRGSISVVDAGGGVVFSLGDVDRPCLPALGRQGASGTAADRERHRRAIRAYRRGDRARLRLPYGRAVATWRLQNPCWQRQGGMHPASNAARIGRLARPPVGRSPQAAPCPRPCTTIAPASMRASSASLAGRGPIPRGYIKAGHRVQQRVRAGTGRNHRRLLTTKRIAASTAARSRPMRFRCPRWPSALPGSAPGPACQRTPRKRRRGSARRWRRTPSWSPGPIASTPRLMEILGERAFIKVGAEGVYCAALPELGYGIALKDR